MKMSEVLHACRRRLDLCTAKDTYQVRDVWGASERHPHPFNMPPVIPNMWFLGCVSWQKGIGIHGMDFRGTCNCSPNAAAMYCCTAGQSLQQGCKEFSAGVPNHKPILKFMVNFSGRVDARISAENTLSVLSHVSVEKRVIHFSLGASKIFLILDPLLTPTMNYDCL